MEEKYNLNIKVISILIAVAVVIFGAGVFAGMKYKNKRISSFIELQQLRAAAQQNGAITTKITVPGASLSNGKFLASGIVGSINEKNIKLRSIEGKIVDVPFGDISVIKVLEVQAKIGGEQKSLPFSQIQIGDNVGIFEKNGVVVTIVVAK